MDDAQTLIATLESAPRIIIGLVREVPPQYLKRRPSPTKWSAHEHACHISTADTTYLLRLELILSDPAPYIKSMLPSAEEEAGSLLKVDLDQALDLYVRERARLVERLKELSDGDWQRTARHETYSHYSVFIMFRDLLLHEIYSSFRESSDSSSTQALQFLPRRRRHCGLDSNLSEESKNEGPLVESRLRYAADEKFQCSKCGTSHNLTELRKVIQNIVRYYVAVDGKFDCDGSSL
jgi:DinB superfamily